MAPSDNDFLSKARSAGAGLLILSAFLAIGGSFLDWVQITPPPEVPADQLARTQPFTGVEARDGWLVVGAGGVLLLLALGIVARVRTLYGWLAFFTSILIGSIGIADFRGLNDLGSAISQRMDFVGRAEAGVGLVLVLVAALLGVIGSLISIAGTPRIEAEG